MYLSSVACHIVEQRPSHPFTPASHPRVKHRKAVIGFVSMSHWSILDEHREALTEQARYRLILHELTCPKFGNKTRWWLWSRLGPSPKLETTCIIIYVPNSRISPSFEPPHAKYHMYCTCTYDIMIFCWSEFRLSLVWCPRLFNFVNYAVEDSSARQWDWHKISNPGTPLVSGIPTPGAAWPTALAVETHRKWNDQQACKSGNSSSRSKGPRQKLVRWYSFQSSYHWESACPRILWSKVCLAQIQYLQWTHRQVCTV